jgi:hypothetical protein
MTTAMVPGRRSFETAVRRLAAELGGQCSDVIEGKPMEPCTAHPVMNRNPHGYVERHAT